MSVQLPPFGAGDHRCSRLGCRSATGRARGRYRIEAFKCRVVVSNGNGLAVRPETGRSGGRPDEGAYRPCGALSVGHPADAEQSAAMARASCGGVVCLGSWRVVGERSMN